LLDSTKELISVGKEKQIAKPIEKSNIKKLTLEVLQKKGKIKQQKNISTKP
jgi:hypothetical protein